MCWHGPRKSRPGYTFKYDLWWCFGWPTVIAATFATSWYHFETFQGQYFFAGPGPSAGPNQVSQHINFTFSSKMNFDRMNMWKRLLWPEICQFNLQKPYRTCRTLIFNFQRKITVNFRVFFTSIMVMYVFESFFWTAKKAFPRVYYTRLFIREKKMNIKIAQTLCQVVNAAQRLIPKNPFFRKWLFKNIKVLGNHFAVKLNVLNNDFLVSWLGKPM